MRLGDLWIVGLVIALLVACIPLKSGPYECISVDPRTGSEVVEKPIISPKELVSDLPKLRAEQPNLGNSSPLDQSACELALERQTEETNNYRQKYFDCPCYCPSED
jgi:hypothetical protein